MILYRKKPLPAYLTDLEMIRVGGGLIGAIEEEFAAIKPYTDGDRCISEQEDRDSITLAWVIPTSQEIAKRIEQWRDYPTATISFTTYKWYWSDIMRFVRGFGSGDYKRVEDCPELSSRKIRSLAARVSIIPFLHYAAETHPILHPTKEEEAKIKLNEKRLFALLKLNDCQQTVVVTDKTTRKVREFPVSKSTKERVLANHKSKCFFSGVSSLEAKLQIHHIIPCRIIELMRLPKSLYTTEFNLVPICADLNVVKSANLTPEDIALCLDRFAAPSHSNHGLVKYLKLIQQMQQM